MGTPDVSSQERDIGDIPLHLIESGALTREEIQESLTIGNLTQETPEKIQRGTCSSVCGTLASNIIPTYRMDFPQVRVTRGDVEGIVWNLSFISNNNSKPDLTFDLTNETPKITILGMSFYKVPIGDGYDLISEDLTRYVPVNGSGFIKIEDGSVLITSLSLEGRLFDGYSVGEPLNQTQTKELIAQTIHHNVNPTDVENMVVVDTNGNPVLTGERTVEEFIEEMKAYPSSPTLH